MGWRILVNFIRQPMLKLKTHSDFYDLFLLRINPTTIRSQHKGYIYVN
jgi:hypothetical protein